MRIGIIGARRTEAASQRVGRGDEVVVRFPRGPVPFTAVGDGTGARAGPVADLERYAPCGLLAGFGSAANPPSSDAAVEGTSVLRSGTSKGGPG